MIQYLTWIINFSNWLGEKKPTMPRFSHPTQPPIFFGDFVHLRNSGQEGRQENHGGG